MKKITNSIILKETDEKELQQWSFQRNLKGPNLPNATPLRNEALIRSILQDHDG